MSTNEENGHISTAEKILLSTAGMIECTFIENKRVSYSVASIFNPLKKTISLAYMVSLPVLCSVEYV